MGKARPRHFLGAGAAVGLAYVGGSYLAARRFSNLLIRPISLTEGPDRRAEFLAELARGAAVAEEFSHPGDPRRTVRLSCVFASPGEPSTRPTVLFIHGKGGNAAEWLPDALRALACGFNVLCPDLRGHGHSEGDVITYGFLERRDLLTGIATAQQRFGIDPRRLGVHGCSAGAAVAIELAADAESHVEALWLESPFADPKRMARHYLHRATGIPSWMLALTTRWAMRRAAARLRRELGLKPGEAGIEAIHPARAAGQIRCPTALVFGRRDALVPAKFVGEILSVLPRHTEIWDIAEAGHCHHADEPSAVRRSEYTRRWNDFFGRHLAPRAR